MVTDGTEAVNDVVSFEMISFSAVNATYSCYYVTKVYGEWSADNALRGYKVNRKTEVK